MKFRNRNRILLLLPTVVLGLVTLVLHQYMMATCFDEKGLLISGNWPSRVLMVIGVGFALYLVLFLRTLGGNGTYRQAFPRCVLSGSLTIAAGVEMGFSLLAELPPDAPWKLALGVGSIVSMIAVGFCRVLGKRPWFIFHWVVCSFYIYQSIINYQRWSANPNIQNFAYQMLACALLMLAAFHRTCCDTGLINRKKLIFTALGAAYCCLASLADPNMPIFYVASGLWAAGCLCDLAQFPTDPEEDEEPQAPSAPLSQAEPPVEDELLAHVDRLLNGEF